MDETLKLFKEASPLLICLAVLAYFGKLLIEKCIDAGFKKIEREQDDLVQRVEAIASTSLEVKKELRGEERKELVDLRVAVDKWEYFLQTVVFDFTMVAPEKAEVIPLYQKDKELFLEVRLAVVKACTYLRAQKLEEKLMSMVVQIRQTYYPLINASLPKLIDLQAGLRLIDLKIKQFEKSGLRDMSCAPTEQDRAESQRLQAAMTEEVRSFSNAFLQQYRGIAEQMNELKEGINYYIYRPIKETDIDKE